MSVESEMKRLRRELERSNQLKTQNSRMSRAKNAGKMIKNLFEGLAIQPTTREQQMRFLTGQNGYQKQIKKLKRSVRKRVI